ncbi:MAG: tRNA cyclic N6-threonylcarbamoyladenosine(37) synthase TcdA [Hahellaceae bacterium]|nr:tRNA cyclic N6-threonylcarbamoyladenosine(37) synthase TcdA [Hahellaceae bacterium]MCP5169145.1 tRNA cyclic N6-threonylcarbamoyladenosine(37) synthase TcdA [Hahellaceae bacterium]
MTSTDFDHRFGGIRRLYGDAALQQLRHCHVAVIGVGGVGSWVAEALARTAVGQITLFDMDDICVSNVNRQIHALNGSIGKLKVEAMAERLCAINPELVCHPEMAFVTEKNLEAMLDRGFDYVVEATDSVKAKAAIINWCVRHKVSVITSGGAGGQIDPTLIQVADLTKTLQDPLASKVRAKLRKDYGFTRDPKRKFGVECVFSTEQLRYPQPDGQVCAQKPAGDGPVKLDCASGFGASTCVTATFGLFAASRVINKLSLRTKSS